MPITPDGRIADRQNGTEGTSDAPFAANLPPAPRDPTEGKAYGADVHLPFEPIQPDGVTTRLRKGESAAKIPLHILVLDTGQPDAPAERFRAPQSQAELDQIYRDAIQRGIVDHHTIDATVTIPVGVERRCSTGMIALAPELVLEQIVSRDVVEITSHQDSDLDSVVASYLAQALKTSRSVPLMARSLAEHVNLVDYGLYREPNPERYVESLAGTFGCLKRAHDAEARAAAGAIWSRTDISRDEKIKESTSLYEAAQSRLLKDTFDLLNACEVALRRAGGIDFADISVVKNNLPLDQRERIEVGKRALLADIQTFDKEYSRAQRPRGVITDRTGQERSVPVIMFAEPQLNPLVITNLCYLRESPETIVVVYNGPNRKHGGDAYNIGIKPETAQSTFTLDHLAVALSEGEARLREPMVSELREKRERGMITEDEEKKLSLLTTPRKGFEHLKIGDPTVCVAGGSLVAASTSSLMGKEEFERIVLAALGNGEA